MYIKVLARFFWNQIRPRFQLFVDAKNCADHLCRSCFGRVWPLNQSRRSRGSLRYARCGARILPDRSTIEVQHENIPGFMPSMTMPFVARNPKEIANLKTSDAISFRMTVTQKDFWIDKVKKVRREEVDVSEPKPTPSITQEGGARLKEGDDMPQFSLTNQDGERISQPNAFPSSRCTTS
jgi:Copper binding periplasmic protein CusF